MLGVDAVGMNAAIVADRIWVPSEAVVVRPPPRLVHVIWPTVNVRPSGTATEAGTMTILFAGKHVRTPPTWRATVDESWSTVYLGVYPR